MELLRMALVNPFFDAGMTYYAIRKQAHASRQDYVAVPQRLLPRISSCYVCENQGAMLQLLADSKPRDHQPLAAFFMTFHHHPR